MPKAVKSKKAAKAAPYKKPEPQQNPLFEARKRNFGIGNDIQPKRDLTRFVRWPAYIKLQRQRRVLYHRLKVPPAINQFTKTLDKNLAKNLFTLLNNYRPEDKIAKRRRLLAVAKTKAAAEKKEKARRKAEREAAGNKAAKPAEKKAAAKPAEQKKEKKPIVVKYGINHITALVEQKKAKLVVIAHDVDPVELVVWLPALCRRQGVPYCIVKGKARLGQVVHKKTATALALVNVRPEDAQNFAQLVTACKENYNEKAEEIRKAWGGATLGQKSVAALRKKQKAIAKEEKARAAANAL